ncbi:hypothetical protein [Actinoplanes sp. NPDC049118]|uniref:hypothetical protein n=1 Tax=Actinoplanes sp. NPDC049118 TaxID=3155769 RepID=UPI0033EC228F
MSRPPVRLIAVIGPPAVGKSTLSRHLQDTAGAGVFRLREFAETYRQAHPAQAAAFATTDPLGWLPDTAVAVLFGAALSDAFPELCPVMVLENLPGNAAQLDLLRDRAAAIGARLDLVVLTAPDRVLADRAQTRRVCASCEPDPRGDPHQPAHAADDDPQRCRRCGGRLAARRSDTPELFQARLGRFRASLPAIRTAALAAHVPCHFLDSTGDITTTAVAVQAACRLTLHPTPLRSAWS